MNKPREFWIDQKFTPFWDTQKECEINSIAPLCLIKKSDYLKLLKEVNESHPSNFKGYKADKAEIARLKVKLKDLSSAKISQEQRWCEKYYDKVVEVKELESALEFQEKINEHM